MDEPKEASYWEPVEGGMVRCLLCPHGCMIAEGRFGICGTRSNVSGRLAAMAYAVYPAVNMDPIEKKPLNHFLPGTGVLSIGSVGCNLTCRMCQNWTLSRGGIDVRSRRLMPEELLAMARSIGSPSVAFTYNEPSMNYEYLMDAAPMLKENGIRTVLVTNGFLRPEPWRDVMGAMDAANIDVKGFTERFYKEIAGGRLRPVLDNTKAAFESGVHVEITYLIIPGENDSSDEIGSFSEWVGKDLSPELPVHFTRFHPDYKMMDHRPTPVGTMEKAREIARKAGLVHVYIGNMAGVDHNDTTCPRCGSLLISRTHLSVKLTGLRGDACSKCGTRLHGVFL